MIHTSKRNFLQPDKQKSWKLMPINGLFMNCKALINDWLEKPLATTDEAFMKLESGPGFLSAKGIIVNPCTEKSLCTGGF